MVVRSDSIRSCLQTTDIKELKLRCFHYMINIALQLFLHYASEVSCFEVQCKSPPMCPNPLPADPENGVCCPICPPGE